MNILSKLYIYGLHTAQGAKVINALRKLWHIGVIQKYSYKG